MSGLELVFCRVVIRGYVASAAYIRPADDAMRPAAIKCCYVPMMGQLQPASSLLTLLMVAVIRILRLTLEEVAVPQCLQLLAARGCSEVSEILDSKPGCGCDEIVLAPVFGQLSCQSTIHFMLDHKMLRKPLDPQKACAYFQLGLLWKRSQS